MRARECRQHWRWRASHQCSTLFCVATKETWQHFLSALPPSFLSRLSLPNCCQPDARLVKWRLVNRRLFAPSGGRRPQPRDSRPSHLAAEPHRGEGRTFPIFCRSAKGWRQQQRPKTGRCIAHFCLPLAPWQQRLPRLPVLTVSSSPSSSPYRTVTAPHCGRWRQPWPFSHFVESAFAFGILVLPFGTWDFCKLNFIF